MTVAELSTAIDTAVEDFLALKRRVADLMGEVARQGDDYEHPKSIRFIAQSMVLVDQCVSECAPAHVLEHVNANFEMIVDGCRSECGQTSAFNPDDPSTWPDEITETDQ